MQCPPAALVCALHDVQEVQLSPMRLSLYAIQSLFTILTWICSSSCKQARKEACENDWKSLKKGTCETSYFGHFQKVWDRFFEWNSMPVDKLRDAMRSAKLMDKSSGSTQKVKATNTR